MTAALLKYPGERIAMFTCSLNAYHSGSWSALATNRLVQMDPAYSYHEPLVVRLRTDTVSRTRRYGIHDQFAPELEHFVARIRASRKTEPSAREGEADIHILDAIDRSARTGRRVRLRALPRDAFPKRRQARTRPAVGQTRIVK